MASSLTNKIVPELQRYAPQFEIIPVLCYYFFMSFKQAEALGQSDLLTEAHGFFADLRYLLQEGGVTVGSGITQEQFESADHFSENGRVEAERLWDMRQASLADIAPKYTFDEDLKADFLDTYAKRAFNLSIASSRAEKKGYINRGIEDLDPRARAALYLVMFNECELINLEVKEVVPLTPNRIAHNPFIYLDSREISSLIQEYPEFTEAAMIELVLTSPRVARQRAEEIKDNHVRLSSKYADRLKPSVVFQLVYTYRDKPEEAIEAYLEDLDNLIGRYPHVKEHILRQITLNARTDPEAALQGFLQAYDRLYALYPELPDYVLQQFARGYKDPVKQVATMLENAREITGEMPVLSESQAIQVATYHTKSPLEAGRRVVAQAQALHRTYPYLSMEVSLDLAINRPDQAEAFAASLPSKIAEMKSLTEGKMADTYAAAYIYTYPTSYLEKATQWLQKRDSIDVELPQGYKDTIAFKFDNAQEEAQAITRDVERMRNEFANIPEYLILERAISQRDIDKLRTSLKLALARANSIKAEYPELAEAVCLRRAIHSPLRHADLLAGDESKDQSSVDAVDAST